MKKYILSLIIFITGSCVSYAQSTTTIDSLKKDSIQKSVFKDTLKYLPNRPIVITPLVSDGDGNKSSKSSKKAEVAKKSGSLSSMSSGSDAGRTVGSLDVSASGAATYTVPIAVPPGINGVVPQVSLSYNSQGGNGVAGYGWNIGGLSSISRIPRTMFHDGIVGAVTGDLNDRFALDGQRLILKSGTYGTNGAEYQTENYSNIKVVSKGSSGITYFEVYYPDGSFAIYGQDYDKYNEITYALKYIDNPQGIRINYNYTVNNKTLLINQITYGAKGSVTPINQINFVYKDRWRKEQSYALGYEFIQAKILSAINVVGNGVDYRHYTLTHNYIDILAYERIESIQESSGDGTKSFEPINFSYDSTTGYISGQSITIGITGMASYNSRVLTGDFTGNGKMDFLLYAPNLKNKFSLVTDPQVSGYTQSAIDVTVPIFDDVFAVNTLDTNKKIINGQGFTFVRRNYLGPRYDFETWQQGSLAAGGPAPSYTRSWTNVPLSGPYYSDCMQRMSPGGDIPREFFSGDFNGDGLTDFIAINQPYEAPYADVYNPDEGCVISTGTVFTSTVHFINIDRRFASAQVNQAGDFTISYQYGDKLFTADFNGDGKTDILHIASGHMYVYTLDANNSLVLLFDTTDSKIVTNYPPLLGDYNGDGKTDIMFPTSSSISTKYIFALFTSTGTSFSKIERYYIFSYETEYWSGSYLHTPNLYATDVNGDGKTDIISTWTITQTGSTTGNVIFSVCNNTGPTVDASGSPFSNSAAEYFSGLTLIHRPIPMFFTVNEPNLSLEFGLLSHDKLNLFQYNKDLRKESGITKVSQDGVDIDVVYKELLPNTLSGGILALYESTPAFTSSRTYPYIDIEQAPGLNVVSNLKRTFESNELFQYFGYRGAATHAAGLGFLGFNRTERSNWITGPVDQNKIFTSTFYDPLLRGAPVKSFVSKTTFNALGSIPTKAASIADIERSTAVPGAETVIASHSITLKPGFLANGTNGTFIAKLDNPATGIDDGGTISNYITRTDYTYKTELQSNKVFINVPLSQSVKDLLNATNTLTTYKYDNYYNTVNTETNLSGAGIKTVQYSYDNNPTSGYIGRLTNKKEIVSNGGDTFSSEVQYNNYSNFLPEQIKKRGNGTPWITENYTFDAYGNITSKQLVSTDGTRTTSSTYDASGRFVATSTDVEGMITTMAYNSSTGNVTSKTNPYGQPTTYDYDVWGRPITITDYLTNHSYKAYNRSGSDIELVETDDEQRSKITISNALGKTKSVIVKDVLGQDIEKDYGYDIYDRQITESEPNMGIASQWNVTEYDEYGRVKKLTAFTGKVSTITYDGLKTTVFDGTKTTVTTKNALGNVIKTEDQGGSINNVYFANGNLKSASYDGSTQIIEQDGGGRKTKLTDPSAGVYTYTYNQFGETLTEVTPKGTTTYTYDNSTGKVQTKQISGSGTNMLYRYYYRSDKLPDYTTIDYGGGNITTYTYTYNSNKWLITGIEDNQKAKFIKTLTYDGFGRVYTEENEAKNKRNNITASKRITNIYNHGEVKEIIDYSTGTSIWKVTALNARGQVTTAFLGTNIKETNTYDTYGYASDFKTEKVSGTPSVLMDLTFTFDHVQGNLTNRTNSAIISPLTGIKWTESFIYDTQLDRLTGDSENGVSHTWTYDTRGRITNNSQVGDYTYTGNSYQQKGLINLSNFSKYHYQDRTPQVIDYNAFKKPLRITETGKELIDFEYNGAEQRSHMYYGNTDLNKDNRPFVRHYAEDGSSEITDDINNNTTSFIFYLGGDAYSAPAIWKKTVNVAAGTTPVDELYYLHRDYLGSILMITDVTGAVREKRQFDAWGNIRMIQDGANNVYNTFLIIDRGYTGHEHLQRVGLINMNGRLYDPILHRFLSPDNFMQNPSNTQNFNRYGYGLNNPLKYTDPSGEFLHILIGAAISVITNGIGNLIEGKNFFDGAGRAAIMGGLGGAAAWGIGNIANGISKGFSIGKAAFQMGAHGVLGGTMSAANGQNFFSGFVSGALSSIVSSGSEILLKGVDKGVQVAGMMASGTLSGGLGASVSGGSFWDGARNGAISAGLNHVAHSIETGIQKHKEYKFFSRLRDHYEQGGGEEFRLTKNEVNFLMANGKFMENTMKMISGDELSYRIGIDYYDSSADLKYSFGRATGAYSISNKGIVTNIGFYDTYDFDPKQWGTRSIKNEIITRGYNLYSKGTPFEITYGRIK